MQVRRLRLFLEQGDEWLLRDARSGRTSLQGLWDQGLFTDAIQSAILGRHLYPYTYLQSDPRHVAWNRTGGGLEWPAPGQDRAPKAVARLHRVQWRMPREREQGDPACSGSWRRPRWLGDAPAAFRRTWCEAAPRCTAPAAQAPSKRPSPPRHKAEPLLWGRLHALDPLAGLGPTATSGDGARAVQPGFLTPTDRYPRRGGGKTASEDEDGEVAAAAPAWFACSPPHAAVTGGWAEARRGGVACALLHLVELRSQFVAFRSLDTRKAAASSVLAWRRLRSHSAAAAQANRPYVMGVYGYLPVDEPSLSAPWPPPGEPLRAVRLSEAPLPPESGLCACRLGTAGRATALGDAASNWCPPRHRFAPQRAPAAARGGGSHQPHSGRAGRRLRRALDTDLRGRAVWRRRRQRPGAVGGGPLRSSLPPRDGRRRVLLAARVARLVAERGSRAPSLARPRRRCELARAGCG